MGQSSVILFIVSEKNGIKCITGDQRYSIDLPQEGLKVPHALQFKGQAKK